ncbi:MAG: hypothetical protein IKC17_06040 [Bacteroidales bacterium]|nr:hypothetical protein [Bacteroidales bacterium]
MKKLLLSIIVVVLSSWALIAQDDKGHLSAGFETNTTYYLDDKGTGAIAPEGKFGSNNYLKLDYTKGGFSVGGQLEAYLPPILGYYGLYGGTEQGDMFYRFDIYASFVRKGWDIRVGSLYEQFGSGILFRTYEDRALGINNALQGVKVGYTFGDFLTIYGIYGRIRDVKSYSNAMASGADLNFSISRLAKMDDFDLSIGASVLDKYETYGEFSDVDQNPHTLGYSARLNMGYKGFQLSGEYVSRKADPAFYNHLDTTGTQSIQVDFGYSGNGFGGLVTFRKLQNPFFLGLRNQSEDNWSYTYINYVPALTQQHTYSLASMNPYTPQADELGGQVDLFYNFKKNTVLGGKKGMKIHGNFSTYYGGIYDMNLGVYGDSELLFRDLTVDVERWFGKDVKMILYYTWQTYNSATVAKATDDCRLWNSHTVIADVTYKINRKNSLRLELQHLYTKEDHKNWAAALLEYNLAPRWSISVQDMWNYGDTKKHYVNGSVSYSYNKVRAALNMGRFKEGYLCSGGVCRQTPAYTGFNLSLVIML